MAAVLAVLGQPTRGNEALVAGLAGLGLAAALVAPFEARRLRRSDVALARLDVLPTLDGIEPGLLEVLLLERRAVRVVNRAGALLSVHDKLRAARLLATAGVSQPRAWRAATLEGLAASELPCVVKPRFGSWGLDVFRCRDRAELRRTCEEIRDRPWFRRHGALVQELVPAPGRDLRLVVAGGRVVGSVERVAAPGEWRTNVSLGGSVRPLPPPPGTDELARRAVAATGVDLAGVDLCLDGNGAWTVLELNGAVEFDGRYSIGARDVYADLADALDLGTRRAPSPDPLLERRAR